MGVGWRPAIKAQGESLEIAPSCAFGCGICENFPRHLRFGPLSLHKKYLTSNFFWGKRHQLENEGSTKMSLLQFELMMSFLIYQSENVEPFTSSNFQCAMSAESASVSPKGFCFCIEQKQSPKWTWVFPKILVRKPPKSSILIGFGTIIFTIHFGGQIPLFLVQHLHGILTIGPWIWIIRQDTSSRFDRRGKSSLIKGLVPRDLKHP